MLLIGNGRMITRDADAPFYENGCVAIADGIIAAVGETEAIRAKYP
ncbi:MAG: chlorohydrolase, partial [Clostridia bacterium]